MTLYLISYVILKEKQNIFRDNKGTKVIKKKED